MTRWINRAVALLLAVAAVLLSVFPPPHFDLRFLPAVVAVILALLLIWPLSQRREISPKHVEELRSLAGRLLENIDKARAIEFSPDAQQEAVLRGSFKSHFPKASYHLEDWMLWLGKYTDAKAALGRAVDAETRRLQQEHGLDPRQVGSFLVRVADSELSNRPYPASVLTILDVRTTGKLEFGRVLLLGGNGIAESHSDTADADLAAARQALTTATQDIADWEEVSAAWIALSALQTETNVLRHELLKIQHTHSLTSRCNLCATFR